MSSPEQIRLARRLGWDTFGTHPELDEGEIVFAGEDTDGLPLFERPTNRLPAATFISPDQWVVWSRDGCTATILTLTPSGVLTSTIKWDDPQVASERVHLAARHALAFAGDEDTNARVVRRIGPFLLHKAVGPPFWRWPRAFAAVSPAALTIGWRHTAYRISWFGQDRTERATS